MKKKFISVIPRISITTMGASIFSYFGVLKCWIASFMTSTMAIMIMSTIITTFTIIEARLAYSGSDENLLGSLI